jgi:hypothetical protein
MSCNPYHIKNMISLMESRCYLRIKSFVTSNDDELKLEKINLFSGPTMSKNLEFSEAYPIKCQLKINWSFSDSCVLEK